MYFRILIYGFFLSTTVSLVEGKWWFIMIIWSNDEEVYWGLHHCQARGYWLHLRPSAGHPKILTIPCEKKPAASRNEEFEGPPISKKKTEKQATHDINHASSTKNDTFILLILVTQNGSYHHRDHRIVTFDSCEPSTTLVPWSLIFMAFIAATQTKRLDQ